MIREINVGALPRVVGPMLSVFDRVNDAEEFAFADPVIPIFRKGGRSQFGAGVGRPLAVFWE